MKRRLKCDLASRLYTEPIVVDGGRGKEGKRGRGEEGKRG